MLNADTCYGYSSDLHAFGYAGVQFNTLASSTDVLALLAFYALRDGLSHWCIVFRRFDYYRAGLIMLLRGQKVLKPLLKSTPPPPEALLKYKPVRSSRCAMQLDSFDLRR